jgi:hypothetical protein
MSEPSEASTGYGNGFEVGVGNKSLKARGAMAMVVSVCLIVVIGAFLLMNKALGLTGSAELRGALAAHDATAAATYEEISKTHQSILGAATLQMNVMTQQHTEALHELRKIKYLMSLTDKEKAQFHLNMPDELRAELRDK